MFDWEDHELFLRVAEGIRPEEYFSIELLNF